MKRIVGVISFIFIYVFSFSVDVKQSEAIAQKYYAEGKYTEAIEMYESLLPQDKESAPLYYNLGNAYYKNNETAKAILNYERALLIVPNFDDAKYNLQIAQLKVVDKIDEVDKFFFSRWFQSLSDLMTSNSWAWLSAVLFIFFIILALVYAFGRGLFLRKFAFFTGLLLFMFSLVSFTFSFQQKNKVEKREYGIIMDPSITVKSSPDHSGNNLFVIHEGTKIKIKSSLGEWYEIQLSDGNVGWIKQLSIERI